MDFFHAQGVLWVDLTEVSHGLIFAWLLLSKTGGWGSIQCEWTRKNDQLNGTYIQKTHGFFVLSKHTEGSLAQMLLHSNDMLGDGSSRKTTTGLSPKSRQLGSSGTGLVQVSPPISVYHRIYEYTVHILRVDILYIYILFLQSCTYKHGILK